MARSRVEYADWNLTVYDGECPLRCRYCVQNEPLWIYRRTQGRKGTCWAEAHKLKKISESMRVVISFTSDPYQPRELKEQLTREMLKILLPTHHTIMILTKSSLAERDFPLLAQFKNVKFGMTLTSTKAIPDEPFATPNPQRFETLKKAHDMGIETWVSIEPWIPNVTFPEQILEASKEFVDFYILGALQYEKRHGYPTVPPNFYEEQWLKIQHKFAEPDCPWGFLLKRELHPRFPYA